MMLKKILLVGIFWSCGHTLMAQSGEQEANLKAAFIYNFTKYIDWGSYDNDYVFVIGVAGGDSPILAPLQEIAKTRTINNKKIDIRIIDGIGDLAGCDIVFIAKGGRIPLSSILNNVGKGVLTIGESKGYALEGTDFNFVIVDQRLKFEANLKAIDAAGLKAGAQLLKLAIIVGQG